ncbi:acyl-CoA synthetase [Bradyrhizobium sp. 191]|nr:acyl-CoA synthetase [Bradyrhizobium sp. 191]
MPILKDLAARRPAKVACRMADGSGARTFAELDMRSNRIAQFFLSLDLRPGDGIAMLLDNSTAYFELAWAARRAGLYYTPISTHLKQSEIEYVVRDCGAKILLADERFAPVLEALPADLRARCATVFVGAGGLDDLISTFREAVALPVVPMGKDFFYSSGTTGQPKGIKQGLGEPPMTGADKAEWNVRLFGFGADTVYLSPAPLYHAASLRFSMKVIDGGGSVVVLPKFEALGALRAIETHRVTHSQWVPTMFVRMLALPAEERAVFDLASHRVAVHAAAPCPVELKEQMMAWWGPIIWEYYAGSERNGVCCISPQDWLAHKGSVGRAVLGKIHIVDDTGRECFANETGQVYFDGPKFEYHGDPGKTEKARTAQGWSTLGDIGHLDADGFLYLTDRKAHMIISGGVNIYPAEIENALVLHPAVADAAVFGLPNPDYGEEVKAVVQLQRGRRQDSAMAGELLAFCRSRLSNVKCPRSIDFVDELPRLDNGKLYKTALKQRYLDGGDARSHVIKG